jgi:hypothetical protein
MEGMPLSTKNSKPYSLSVHIIMRDLRHFSETTTIANKSVVCRRCHIVIVIRLCTLRQKTLRLKRDKFLLRVDLFRRRALSLESSVGPAV